MDECERVYTNHFALNTSIFFFSSTLKLIHAQNTPSKLQLKTSQKCREKKIRQKENVNNFILSDAYTHLLKIKCYMAAASIHEKNN